MSGAECRFPLTSQFAVHWGLQRRHALDIVFVQAQSSFAQSLISPFWKQRIGLELQEQAKTRRDAYIPVAVASSEHLSVAKKIDALYLW